MERYVPPFDTTDEMLTLVGDIMELLGHLKTIDEVERMPQLRKVSRVQSIHSSLVIENNSLSLEQVTDVINGKRVLAPQEDITAVKNANSAYAMLGRIDPYSLTDLLKVHGIMMHSLVSEAGQLRSGQVGVYNNEGKVIHIAPSYELVPELMNQLFDWTAHSKVNMLIRSCVFHYEFEFIHPFRDGNGRMGRLWQTALLASWRPVFAYIPIESVIKDNQEQYYNAINLSNSEGKSDAFIEFMLATIKTAILHISIQADAHLHHISTQVNALMSVMQIYPQSCEELMQKLGLKSRASFVKNYLSPALSLGLIARTIPDKPTSKNQRYYRK